MPDFIFRDDFKLIDQSDMIVSYVPELPDGKPGLSSGVERELQHRLRRAVLVVQELRQIRLTLGHEHVDPAGELDGALVGTNWNLDLAGIEVEPIDLAKQLLD